MKKKGKGQIVDIAKFRLTLLLYLVRLPAYASVSSGWTGNSGSGPRSPDYGLSPSTVMPQPLPSKSLAAAEAFSIPVGFQNYHAKVSKCTHAAELLAPVHPPLKINSLHLQAITAGVQNISTHAYNFQEAMEPGSKPETRSCVPTKTETSVIRSQERAKVYNVHRHLTLRSRPNASTPLRPRCAAKLVRKEPAGPGARRVVGFFVRFGRDLPGPREA
jgi:hypothetical protein